MIRLGLCCKFVEQPIHFRITTLTNLKRQKDPARFLSTLIEHNFEQLEKSILFCHHQGIGSFRITSRFFPLYTHPQHGYSLEDLPDSADLYAKADYCKRRAKDCNVRLTTHPDQFVVVNSLRHDVVENSLRELEYHGFLADLLGIDLINIHAGGVYGDKKKALERLEKNLERLSERTRRCLTIENDDKSYTPQDLLPICNRIDLPLVYDVHHHRCLPDRLGEEEATLAALETWRREPLFHLSSPLNGWQGSAPFKHADYIDFQDFPKFWMQIDPLTVEIEAKAKELAVLQLASKLNS
ncbi:MAG: UV DNA damage repair endonuclease UvsE [Chlamydiota bacterium]